MAEGKNTPYNTIMAYGAAMVSIPSEISYGGYQKIGHVILPW